MGLAAATYQPGLDAGYADGGLVIDNPPDQNGHPSERFIQTRDRYEAAILAPWPGAYQAG